MHRLRQQGIPIRIRKNADKDASLAIAILVPTIVQAAVTSKAKSAFINS
jgi:hypothetical protein